MRYSHPQIYLQEVPDEISLGISISGCQIKCKDCHSKITWNKEYGEELDPLTLDILIKRNKHISCILFFGGEWHEQELYLYLKLIKERYKLKTALYSGSDNLNVNLMEYLDYYKTGPYIAKNGGLDSKNTNQKFFKIHYTKSTICVTDYTYKFKQKEWL